MAAMLGFGSAVCVVVISGLLLWRSLPVSFYGFRFWAKGQPNQRLAIDQDCVEFWSSSSTHGSWNDEACSIKAKWVCKK